MLDANEDDQVAAAIKASLAELYLGDGDGNCYI
jgi:hypothetical protein